MSASSRSVQWLVWGFLFLTVLVIGGAFLRSKTQPVEATGSALPVIGRVADFSLTNQFGQTISLAHLRGKVWVADIIFTRCPGPCATMTQRMSELQAALPPSQPVQLVSLTTDPEFDTPAVFKKYAERFKAQPDRWHFLTGTKADLVKLAVNSLKLTVLDQEEVRRTSPNDLFIHSTIFVVVDKQGRLRAVFESLDKVLSEEEVTTGASHQHSTWEKSVKPRLLETVNALLLESDQ